MRRHRIHKRLLLSILMIGLLLVFSPFAEAQKFPTKPITLVLPKGAGGTHDLTARAITSVSQKIMGQPFVILLKPGGGGAIASDMVAKADPDGYTLLYGDVSTNSSLPALMDRSKGPDDLAAVCQLGVNNSIAFTRDNAPYKTFKEMIDYAKANPGVIKFATPGALSKTEIEWREIMAEMGIKTKVIPYEGGNSALAAVLGGHADITSTGIPACGGHIKAGKLVGLYVVNEKRDANFPNIPTFREVGVSRLNTFWRAVLAPKGTPRPIIDKLAADFKKMIEDKSVKEMLTKMGDTTQYMGPDEFTKYWLADYAMYKKYKTEVKK